MTFPQWGTAVWGTDRWPALTVDALLQQPPEIGRGHAIGVGDWYLSVEALLPADELSLWGVAVWGEETWNTLKWVDLTPYCRGLEWVRGSDEPYGRARVGELALTLDDRDDRWSPWNPAPPSGGVSFFGPGTVVRVGLRSATDTRASGWIPQITCVVDSWGQTYTTANLADRYIDLVAYETLRELAQIDDNALPGVVGGGEQPPERLERLLEAAQWPYGLKIEAQNVIGSTAFPLQSTDMANNRLAECYLVADSCDAYFVTDRTGAALLTSPEYIGVIGSADPEVLPLVDFSWFVQGDGDLCPTIGLSTNDNAVTTGGANRLYAEYIPESFMSGPNDRNVVNDARYSRVGGTQQVHEQLTSIGKFGRRTLVRNDLIVNNDAAVLQIAFYTSIRRALNVMRITAIETDTLNHPDDYALALLCVDYYIETTVVPPTGFDYSPTVFLSARVATVRHRVVPHGPDGVTEWRTVFGFDTRTIYNLPGAQLPSTPL